MRRADSGSAKWITHDAGPMWGVLMGFGSGMSHAGGIAGITSALGVPTASFPQGIEARQATLVPGNLHFEEYRARSNPRDARTKLIPAAFLILPTRFDEPVIVSNHELSSQMGFMSPAGGNSATDEMREVSIIGAFGKKFETDLVTAWDSHGFCINVRGESEVGKLKKLYEAFLEKDVAVFAGSSGLTFIVVSALRSEQRDRLATEDAYEHKLARAAEATGIPALLKQCGKQYHALSPDWYDREAQGEVIFFLNPAGQRKYNFGWFTAEELTQWTQDLGPIVRQPALDAFEALPENKNWSYDLLVGLNAKGLGLRYNALLVWADADKSVPGIRLRVTFDSESTLPSGVYPFKQLQDEYFPPAAATTTTD